MALLMEQVRHEAEVMAYFVMRASGGGYIKPSNKYCETMIRAVTAIMSRQTPEYIIAKEELMGQITNKTEMLRAFADIADEVHKDGIINWGRIVGLYSTAAQMTSYMDNNKSATISYDKNDFANFVGICVSRKFGEWIISQGGWDAFVEFFPSYEGWRDGLICYIANVCALLMLSKHLALS